MQKLYQQFWRMFMELNFTQVISLMVAYLLGSIPVGYVLSAIGGYGDIRTKGSGNIGATNMLRSTSKFLAAFTLIFDVLKGYLAVYIGRKCGTEVLSGLLAMLGHIFPIWLKFKGGKGVATYLGVLWAFSGPLALQVFLVWVGFIVLFHYASLASIAMALSVPITVWIWGYEDLFYATCLMSAIVILKHWQNILRLIKGEELPTKFK